jgi:N4-(beta-N-acetylglucosaminyl)-L-asparaginase
MELLPIGGSGILSARGRAPARPSEGTHVNDRISRRRFLGTTSAVSLAAAFGPSAGEAGQAPPAGVRPIMISSANGLEALKTGMAILKKGGATARLDAIVETVAIVEADPRDDSVGYGGLPNSDGEVELDCSIMDGPSYGAGAVAALKCIMHPSKVARLVMERTGRVLIVGEGALRFAIAHGFKKEDLLTDASREKWLRWKEQMSDIDDWGPPKKDDVPAYEAPPATAKPTDPKPRVDRDLDPATWDEKRWGTINCLALDTAGDLSGITTTSGLAFKIPGRVGDSPLVGCGLYVDNEVGAAGSTGVGEECIKIVGAHTVVEYMRQGLHPREAATAAVKRVLSKHGNAVTWNLNFYAVNKAGQHGGAAIQRGSQYAVHDGTRAVLVESSWVLERKSA